MKSNVLKTCLEGLALADKRLDWKLLKNHSLKQLHQSGRKSIMIESIQFNCERLHSDLSSYSESLTWNIIKSLFQPDSVEFMQIYA